MPEKLSWKDTNLALIGSEIDHKVKEAAAQGEEAWKGMGEKPEVRVWRIEKFQVKAWPKEQYGEFFKGDSYIVMKTYKNDDSDKLEHDIHIWIGADSTQDEYGTAAYKMVEADEYLKGVPVQHRQVQGKESKKFQSYFGSLQYFDGGVESGFRHVEPTVEKPILFRVKSSGKQILMTQMAMSKSSLNEGDSFILCADKAHVWCWNGKDVSLTVDATDEVSEKLWSAQVPSEKNVVCSLSLLFFPDLFRVFHRNRPNRWKRPSPTSGRRTCALSEPPRS